LTTKNERYQSLFSLYRIETGKAAMDMHQVAEWMLKRGVEAPTPETAVDRLAKQLSIAARDEHRRDPETGLDYRANHAYKVSSQDGKQLTLWVELETATRPQMHMSLTSRRDQMIGDGTQLKIDEIVWNNKNPEADPINMVLDLTDDIEERLNSPEYVAAAAV
jgi:hypothetical protein